MDSFHTSLAKSLLSLAFARLYRPQDIPTRSLAGQTAIVTGANSGIGLSIAVALAKQGAHVHLACRNADRSAAALEHVVAQCDEKSQANVTCGILDTSSRSSVRTFCEQWPKGEKIDMLVHNAGIAAPPTGSATRTKEGLDIVYATNFLGSFLMTHLLEPHLSSTARVVMTSSTGSYSAVSYLLGEEPSGKATPRAPGIIAQTITKVKALLGIASGSSASEYGISKAQQVVFAALLQRRFNAQSRAAVDCAKTNRTAHAFTPGFTSTPIFGKFDVTWQTWFSNPLFAILKTTEKWIAVPTDEGAKTGVWLASWGDEIGTKERGGGFWERMQLRTSVVDLMDEERRRKEWSTWESDAAIAWST